MAYLLLSILCVALAIQSRPPPKCIATAPYNLRHVDTQLAVDKAVREAQAWYEYRLTWAAENINLHSAPERQAIMNNFMEVYCPVPYFEEFIGITGTGEAITNRTQVQQLYEGSLTSNGADTTFEVKAYNTIVTINSKSDHAAVYANITAFSEHVIRSNAYGEYDMLLVLGYYLNEWRIDSEGNVCLSKFHDVFLKVFKMNHTVSLSYPWDLKM